jgi:Tol biopolymer transport system component
MLLGTVGYMSPEQAQGRPVDARSDIFSFGCVLYEAVTGTRAFSGASAIDTLHRIVTEDPPSLSATVPASPAELQRIVRKCLAKDPQDRYQSIREVAIDLRDLRRQLDSGSAVAAIPAHETPRSSRRFAVGGAAAAVLALALGGWLFFSRSTKPPDPSAPLRLERVTTSGVVTDAALSLDGKYVAYTESARGQQSLSVRQIDGTSVLQLIPPRPVGYWGSTFAPDGTSIFFALKGPDEPPGGSLNQIPILGGPTRRLLSGIDSAVSFSPDGKSVAYLRSDFPNQGESSLMVANVDGTNPHTVATRRPPEFFAPGFFVAPSWSPDGARISVGVRNTQTRDAVLAVIGAADGAERRFSNRYTDVGFTKWLPDGSGIVFIARGTGFSLNSGGQIWLQPILDGPVRRLTTDLVDYRNASISGDGRSMVSVGVDVAPSLWTIPLDGKSSPRKLTSTRYDGVAGVAWLRERILFTTFGREDLQIWIMNADGSNRRPLTSDGASAWPRPSPDGQFIAFSGRRGDQRGIWRMNLDGSDVRLLAQVPGATHLHFTPDGQWITFTSYVEGTPGLWRVKTEGGTPDRIIPSFDRAVRSPDGHRLLGILTEGSHFGLAVLPAEGGQPFWVPSETPASTGGGIFEWRPDNDAVYFTTAERSNLWSFRLGQPKSVKVTDFSEDALVAGDISSDGSTMLVSRGPQLRDAFLITNFK